MARNFIAVVVGIFCAMMIIGSLELINSLSYPLPPELRPTPDFSDPNDRAAMAAFVEQLPLQALVVVLAAHGLGVFFGALAAAWISRRLGPGLLVGGFILLGGVMNLYTIAHPLWFGVVDLCLYMPLAYGAAVIFASDEPVEDEMVDDTPDDEPQVGTATE